jgi:coenzyme F420-reducing hydrogenase alpha subunit
MTHVHERKVRVGSPSRVEGEGAMRVRLNGSGVKEVRLEIHEPPRVFEAFLRGRSHTEVPDIVARVCGIYPVAHQMSACLAIEDACGVRVDGQLAALRRLLYCGEWIESHALHIYSLHAPDFLGYPSAIDMARDHRADVERGLALMKVGIDLKELVGGRAGHPGNVRIGGFSRVPSRSELAPVRAELRRASDLALETVAWVAGFDIPDAEVGHAFLALNQDGCYPLDGGTVITNIGRGFPVWQFEDYVLENQVPHSTALHTELVDGTRYLTGPLARYSLDSRHLSPSAAEAARAAGLGPVCSNPFRSIVVRAVEAVYAIDEALRIIDAYEPPGRPSVDVRPRAGRGCGATEAPRGVLYHRYDLAEDGTVTAARIIRPTSQNQAAIEDELYDLVEANPSLDDEALTALCERAIHNHV